jgi:hypothetical protein
MVGIRRAVSTAAGYCVGVIFQTGNLPVENRYQVAGSQRIGCPILLIC